MLKESSIKAHVNFQFKDVQVVKEDKFPAKATLQTIPIIQKVAETKDNVMVILKKAISQMYPVFSN